VEHVIERIGDGSKLRIFAMIIDGLLAGFVGILAAIALPDLSAALRATVCCVAYLGYYFVSEGMWGRTLGKALTGLVVRRVDGTLAGWPEAAVRTLLRALEVNPILLGALPGGLLVTFSKRKQRLGDILAHTLVVRAR
jgi:uncharacterized RDD family membrane protein YckC